MVTRRKLLWLRLGGVFDRSGTAMTALSVLPPRPTADRPNRA